MSTQPLTHRLPFLPALAGAAPERAAQVRTAAKWRWTSSTGRCREASAGASTRAALPPERAMRRLRNLLVCGLIRRDLAGQAN
jgi:glutamate-ammonia-ligase adenylyltransferase